MASQLSLKLEFLKLMGTLLLAPPLLHELLQLQYWGLRLHFGSEAPGS